LHCFKQHKRLSIEKIVTMSTSGLRSLVLTLLVSHVTGNDVQARAVTTPAPTVSTHDTLVHLQGITDDLSHKLDDLNHQLGAFRAEVANKTAEINHLNSQLNVKADQIKNLTHDLSAEQSKLTTLDTYCHSHLTSLGDHVTKLETTIAFTVHFSNDSLTNNNTATAPHHTQRLWFDAVQYQTGGENYNKTTGYFHAPVSGNYAFYLTIQRNDPTENSCLEAYIFRNDRYRLATVTACPSGYSTAANMAVAWMNHGDRVSVTTLHSEDLFGFVHTMFSGWKL